MNFLKNVTKNVPLDQTTYGAIQSARWGAQDRTFPDPYMPPWVWKTIVLALGRRCPPAGQKKSCQKGRKPEPAAEPALALGNPLTHNQDKESSLTQPTKKVPRAILLS